MKLFYRYAWLCAGLLFSIALGMGIARADDTITLENGKAYSGHILFWDKDEFVISVEGKAERLKVSEIKRIDFDPSFNRAGTK